MPCGSHTAARGDARLGVVQGHCLQRGTSLRAYSPGETTEMFPACLLLAAPLGHPSATSVPEELLRQGQSPALYAQPPSRIPDGFRGML